MTGLRQVMAAYRTTQHATTGGHPGLIDVGVSCQDAAVGSLIAAVVVALVDVFIDRFAETGEFQTKRDG
jgi:hypothetical protein